jgi:putative heme-binding domain-containing protein
MHRFENPFAPPRLSVFARGLFVFLCLPLALHAQKNATIPDSDPEAERRTFIVAPGFEVNLFAADPMLAKPIQMNWDADGRLWVACSETYPQIKPGAKANDKIIILEDTKGKGVADKVSVFADGLLIPTGVLPGDGGAYVANSTEILHLSASKPGEKADKRRVVLSGFGTEDTHHIIHTFRWGPDGAMYFNQSVYIHSHVETPHGVQRLNGGGIWRYEPKSQKLSVFARGFWNPWGHAFDKYGNSFATDGAGSIGIAHVFPGACFPTGGNQAPRVLPGLNPGSPKYCGLEIVSGRHFPDDWQGDCITNDFRGHRVCRFKLRDSGSTFESREMTEVIKSTHPAFRPIDVSIGPDGALYIADWYNPIIQHGEVDFRDPRRDTTHGRIWRVTAKGRPLVERPDLHKTATKDLLPLLRSPEQWTAAAARRVLLERDLPNDPDFRHWQEVISASDDPLLMERLWLFAAGVSKGIDIKQFKAFGESNDAGVRSQAARHLTSLAGDPKLGEYGDLGRKLLKDDSPRVRLEAIRSLANAKSPESVALALQVLDAPIDPTLEYALWLTIRDLEPQWLPEFIAGKLDFGGDARKLTFALSAAASKDVIPGIVKQLEKREKDDDTSRALFLLLAKIGGPAEMTFVFKNGYSNHNNHAYWRPVMEALEESMRVRKVAPKHMMGPDAWDGLIDLTSNTNNPTDGPLRQSALRIMGLLKDDWFRDILQNHARDDADAEDRRAALDGLVSLGGAKSVTFVKSLTAAATPVQTRCQAVTALASLDLAAAAKEAAAFLASAKPGDELGIVFRAFVQQKNGPALLAKALEGKTVAADVAKIGLKSARNAPALAEALTKAGRLGAAKKDATPEEVKAITADALTKGDAARGEAIYRRKELQCLQCHAVSGAGGAVGPDLASIGASAQADYIVESLLLPNKAVKEGYNTLDIVRTDGKLVSGIKVRETPKEIVLRDKDDKEVTIALDDIDSKKNGRTLMPDGTTDSLTRAELLDLVKFLTVLGKVGDYEPRKERLVRTWDVIESVKENVDRFRRGRVAVAAEPGETLKWGRVYSRVRGDLDLEDVPRFVVWTSGGPQSFVRFKLNAAIGGPVKLKLADAAGIEMFANGKVVTASNETVFDVSVGETVVTLILDRAQATKPLRVELDDVKDSPARVSVVNGK